MRKTAILAGLYLFCLIIFKTSTASALTPPEDIFDGSLLEKNELSTLVLKKEPKKAKKSKKIKKIHTVAQGDSLSSIAKKYKVSWERIFDNNTSLSDPNQIHPGDKLEIPSANKKLKKRVITASMPSQSFASSSSPTISYANVSNNSSVDYSYRGSSAGNGYVQGYCTWYVKNRRPDLPNNLGNADTWAARAASQGYATGNTPRAGAVGQQGMHVVYVERVNRNGTVLVSEMNYAGFGVKSSRTVSASNFRYIY